MLLAYKNGITSVILRLHVVDANGLPKTGLLFSSTGLLISTLANNESAATVYSAAGSTTETITTLGTYAAPTATKCRFNEVDATNHPGLYEIQIADARYAVASARYLDVQVQVTGGLCAPARVQLTQVDLNDSVRGGMTSLPNAAAEASGGLATLSAAQASNGTINANVHRWLTGTPNALQSGRVDSYLGAAANGVIAAATFAVNALDAVWSTAARTLTAFAFSVTVGTNNDKSGYSLSAAGVQAIWDALTSALTTIGSVGKLLVDRIDAAISSRSSHTAADVWAAGTRTLTSGANIVLAKGVGVTGFNDLDAAGVRAAVGLASANLDTQLSALSTLLTAIAGYVDTEVAAIKAKTDNLPSDPADASDIASSFASIAATLATIAAYIDTEVAAIKAKTDNLPSDPADASDIAAAFSSVASTLATITGYIDTEVSAIKAKTDNLPTDPADASDIAASFAAVAAQLVTIASYIDTEVAAIKAKTDNLPASPAATGDAMTLTSGERNAVADAYLDRADAVETGVTPRQYMRLDAAAQGGDVDVSGSGSTRTVAIKAFGNPSKTRVQSDGDEDGNRDVTATDLT